MKNSLIFTARKYFPRPILRLVHQANFALERPFWQVVVLMNYRASNQKSLISKTCAFVMHLDLGIEARNRNASRSFQIFHDAGVDVLSSRVTYYEDVHSAVSSCKAELGINTVFSSVRWFYEFPQVSGQIGVYHSFLNAINDFLSSDKDYLIVLEDDFRMSDNFLRNLTTLMYLGKNQERDLIKLYTVPKDTRYFIRKSFYGPTLKVFRRDCCAVMLLSRKAARVILEDLKKFGIRVPLDWYLFNFREVGDPGKPILAYEVNPFFVPFGEFIEEAKQSTIANKYS